MSREPNIKDGIVSASAPKLEHRVGHPKLINTADELPKPLTLNTETP